MQTPALAEAAHSVLREWERALTDVHDGPAMQAIPSRVRHAILELNQSLGAHHRRTRHLTIRLPEHGCQHDEREA